LPVTGLKPAIFDELSGQKPIEAAPSARTKAQHAIGLQMSELKPAKYQDQVRAYGTVLDLAALTTLNTNYISAVSQLNTARARLAASQPAFMRAQALYAKNIGNLVQVQTTEAAVIADRAAVAALDTLDRSGQWRPYCLTPAAAITERRPEVWVARSGSTAGPPPRERVEWDGKHPLDRRHRHGLARQNHR
jgi:hypothetical protein